VQAYLFTQWIDGNYERYIIVSALKHTSPILEYSENKPPEKANLNDKGFYFIPNIVYDKSRAAIMAKRWYFIPMMLPHFLEFNIKNNVEENKGSWNYYLEDEDAPHSP